VAPSLAEARVLLAEERRLSCFISSKTDIEKLQKEDGAKGAQLLLGRITAHALLKKSSRERPRCFDATRPSCVYQKHSFPKNEK
jgi:hypothetical protein